jgi:hypothetical protein
MTDRYGDGVRRLLAVSLVVILAACGSDDSGSATSDPPPTSDQAATAASTPETATSTTPPTDEAAEQRHPDVIGATATFDGGAWTVSATLSSPYDSPGRYADAWRVVGPDGTVYGERILLHDHAAEQPFTRSQSGIEIPEAVAVVTIEGRDQVYGWGGATFELVLER